jgi:uncharacterized protein (DUF924 family)
MSAEDWRAVYNFWFPPKLDEADVEIYAWWLGDDIVAELAQFTPMLEAARAGRLDDWSATAAGRLTLILLLDHFSRRRLGASLDAYTADPYALRLAEAGIRNGHYEALTKPWERLFYLMPLIHAEGPHHSERLERVIVMLDTVAHGVPEPSQSVYRYTIGLAQGHLETIRRYGRFPHRNATIGRTSTPEEAEYVRKGDFVHLRRPTL